MIILDEKGRVVPVCNVCGGLIVFDGNKKLCACVLDDEFRAVWLGQKRVEEILVGSGADFTVYEY